MRLLLLAVCLGLASAQGGWQNVLDWFANNNNNNDYAVDYVHNYRFEDHDNQNGYHLLIAISDTNGMMECHLIEVSSTWEHYLEEPSLLHMISEDIYHMLEDHTGQETDLSRDELRETYGDTDALRECFNHSVFIMVYTPSQAIVQAAQDLGIAK